MLKKIALTMALAIGGVTLLFLLALPDLRQSTTPTDAESVTGYFKPAPIIYKPNVFGPAPTEPVSATRASTPSSKQPPSVQQSMCAAWRKNVAVELGQKVYPDEPPTGCLERGESVLTRRANWPCPQGDLFRVSLSWKADPADPDPTRRIDGYTYSCRCNQSNPTCNSLDRKQD